MSDPRNRLPDSESAHETSSCQCGCRSEILHIAELHQDFPRILANIDNLGEIHCFARSQHCILGSTLVLPRMMGTAGYFHCNAFGASIHLNTTAWRHAYLVQEKHPHIGHVLGLEFYDADHNALFRTFLTPSSEQQHLQTLAHQFYKRTVHPTEMAAWKRMGNTYVSNALWKGAPEHFADMDAHSTPFSQNTHWIDDEKGFCGSLPLAYAILLEACEEDAELAMTVSGSVGRFTISVSPKVAEYASENWLYAGEPGQALRLNLNAVSSFWIGRYYENTKHYSYIEALDAYGDLVLRICSENDEKYRYWQAIASGM